MKLDGALIAFLRDRQRAFHMTFLKLQNAYSIREAFAIVFDLKQPAGQIVLRDLAFYCRANESCVVPGDKIKTAMLEGRREVWLRINEHLHLDVEQLYQLYSGNPVAQQGERK